eukprot:10461950-Ditylum_brightwellii.AAC.1
MLSTQSCKVLLAALAYECHRSVKLNMLFFHDYIVALPWSLTKDIPGLQLSPAGIIPQPCH